ncbi:hypothetical protein HPP92_006253 [Vanilla planifolia]|uniref:Protein SDA1 n=1 Tax=Vanilla planifolia TaxID=51239 RepID=A0A835RP38_VANPL|nr:hypothetical protein HPP92_006253 [Vanilla planifolia]
MLSTLSECRLIGFLLNIWKGSRWAEPSYASIEDEAGPRRIRGRASPPVRHFEMSLLLFLQQSTLSSSSDLVVSKDLDDLTMFLVHMTQYYPRRLVKFPHYSLILLQSEVRTLPSSLCSNPAQAIILVNKKAFLIVDQGKISIIYFSYRITKQIVELDVPLELFLDLRIGEEELRARRVMVSALSILLGYERVDDDDDSEASSDEDDECTICPSFLVKKDRGRPIDSKARRKAFGEVSATNDVPGVELLKQDDDEPLYSSYEDEIIDYGSEAKNDSSPIDSDICARVAYEEDEDSTENDGGNDSDEEGLDDRELANACNTKELNEVIEVQAIPIDGQDEDADDGKDPSNGKKRKLGNFVECLNAIDARPCSLKRLVIKAAEVSINEADGILSNEDFQRIKELKANKEEKKALSQHGLLRKDEGYKAATFKIPSSEQLSAKRVNPVKLEAHVRSKLSK